MKHRNLQIIILRGIFIGRLPEDVASSDAKTREAEEYLSRAERRGGGRGRGEGRKGEIGGTSRQTRRAVSSALQEHPPSL